MAGSFTLIALRTLDSLKASRNPVHLTGYLQSVTDRRDLSARIVCGTFEQLAEREKVNRGDMSRVPRLTLLAPDIVEAILDGRQPGELQLDDLLEGFPLAWEGQKRELELLP